MWLVHLLLYFSQTILYSCYWTLALQSSNFVNHSCDYRLNWIYLVLSPSLIVQFSYFFSQFTEHQGHSLERKLFITVLHNSVQYLPAYVKILIKSLKRDLTAHTQIKHMNMVDFWKQFFVSPTDYIQSTQKEWDFGNFFFEIRPYCWMNCNKLFWAVSANIH